MLTADVDAAIDRADLPAVIGLAQQAGLAHRRVAGVDMLIEAESPKARSAVQLVFVNEKVRPEYVGPVPCSPAVETEEGILLAPVADLVRMKLTSYRPFCAPAWPKSAPASEDAAARPG
mgnify:CR=1 FL=1